MLLLIVVDDRTDIANTSAKADNSNRFEDITFVN